METPLVSVVMSVFNGERFLREAVESILNQSFRDFEFVIIDDGSKDASASILGEYERCDPRVRVYHQQNRGLVESLIRGCALAQGKYIARMDADDVAVRDRLMWQVEFMESNPGVGILGGLVEFIDAAGSRGHPVRYPLRDAEIQQALLLRRPSFCHPALVLRKEVLVSVGGYRKLFVEAAEDYDLWLRLAEQCELANLGTVILSYRIHPNQLTHLDLDRRVVCGLAAQAAASLRRKGMPDPLNSVKEITPAVLGGLGITEEALERAILRAYRARIVMALQLRLDLPILPLVSQMLAKLAESKHVQPSVAAGVWGAAARAYLSRGKVLKAVAAAARAFLVHPALPIDIGRREYRRLLRWAGRRAR